MLDWGGRPEVLYYLSFRRAACRCPAWLMPSQVSCRVQLRCTYLVCVSSCWPVGGMSCCRYVADVQTKRRLHREPLVFIYAVYACTSS